MSYRYVWNYLQKIEKAVGESVVETFRSAQAELQAIFSFSKRWNILLVAYETGDTKWMQSS